MKEKEFIELVRNLRAKQKEYFRTRQGMALIEAKDLEKQVDVMLAEFAKKKDD